MAITSKNIQKIKHQRERIKSRLKCTDVSLRPSKQQNLLPETSRTEGGGRPSEFSHLLLELLPVARSESSPGSPLLELLERGRREKGEWRRGRGGTRMTGQVWNLHSLLVVHAIGVMSHPYCCGRVGGNAGDI